MRYVQICAAPVLTAAFLALWPISAAAQQNWQRYVVAETGGSVDVPTHIFSEEVGKPEAGHGALFQTSDRRANLTVQPLSTMPLIRLRRFWPKSVRAPISSIGASLPISSLCRALKRI